VLKAFRRTRAGRSSSKGIAAALERRAVRLTISTPPRRRPPVPGLPPSGARRPSKPRRRVPSAQPISARLGRMPRPGALPRRPTFFLTPPPPGRVKRAPRGGGWVTRIALTTPNQLAELNSPHPPALAPRSTLPLQGRVKQRKPIANVSQSSGCPVIRRRLQISRHPCQFGGPISSPPWAKDKDKLAEDPSSRTMLGDPLGTTWSPKSRKAERF